MAMIDRPCCMSYQSNPILHSEGSGRLLVLSSALESSLNIYFATCTSTLTLLERSMVFEVTSESQVSSLLLWAEKRRDPKTVCHMDGGVSDDECHAVLSPSFSFLVPFSMNGVSIESERISHESLHHGGKDAVRPAIAGL